jgi:hypothetical protein
MPTASSSSRSGGAGEAVIGPMGRLLTRLPFSARYLLVIASTVIIHLTIGTYHTFGEWFFLFLNFQFPQKKIFFKKPSFIRLGNMLPYISSYMRVSRNYTVKHEEMIWIPTFQGLLLHPSNYGFKPMCIVWQDALIKINLFFSKQTESPMF